MAENQGQSGREDGLRDDQFPHKFTLSPQEFSEALLDYLQKTKRITTSAQIATVQPHIPYSEKCHVWVYLKHAIDPRGHMNESLGLVQKFSDEGVATFEWTVQKTLVWWQITWEATPQAEGMVCLYMRVRGKDWNKSSDPVALNGQWDPGILPVNLHQGDRIEIGFKGKPGEAVRAAIALRWLTD